jgi:GH3 auxin-responsive promoter
MPAAPALLRPITGRVASFIGGRFAAHTARRLDRLGNGLAAQQHCFHTLLRSLAGTAFGRSVGLERGMTYEAFHNRVTPRTYEDFTPWIDRMKLGEPHVLCPGRCEYFAVSSGTTAGPSKWLPINQAMLDHFRDSGLDALFFYAQRASDGSVFKGRHLFLGGSSALTPVPGVQPPLWSGDLSGITALNMPGWTERLLYEPGIEIAQMADWPAKLEAIVRRTLSADITLVAGIPSWLLVLAATLRTHAARVTGIEPATLKELWPNLECVIHGGVPIAPFAGELRATFGADVNFHEVYPASEGFIAVQDDEPEAGLRLLADRGIYFEFLPLADFDEQHLGLCDDHVVPLEAVEVGVDYVLLLTTPAGLVRYVIGDVVRFTSLLPPRLVYAGRTRLQLSAFGEHVIERELTDALATVCHEFSATPVNFHVAPLFPDPAAGRPLGRHEWWIELRGAGTPAPGAFGAALDRALAARNDDYAAKRAGHGLELPLVRFTCAGVFEQWLKGAGKWGGQGKTPRCRSDRNVADQLAALAAG